MRIRIDSDVSASFPDLRIGIVLLEGIARGASTPALDAALSEAEVAVRGQASDPAGVQALPMVHAWREVYRAFGANPNRTRPSSEALLRRVVKGDALPRINALVDIYNTATLRWHLPIGGYDLAHLQGDVVLRKSAGGEPFLGIGAESPEPTNKGEIVYADDARVLTRNWNYRDADATKITEASTSVGLFVEAPVKEIDDERVKAIVDYIAQAAEREMGARVKTGIFDLKNGAEYELG